MVIRIEGPKRLYVLLLRSNVEAYPKSERESAGRKLRETPSKKNALVQIRSDKRLERRGARVVN